MKHRENMAKQLRFPILKQKFMINIDRFYRLHIISRTCKWNPVFFPD